MTGERALVDVRRLAAVDMHGLVGTVLRRRVIMAEFVLGAIGGIALGLFLLVASSGAIGALIGVYTLSIGANYIPLALHTWSLRSATALEAELRGVDVRTELRHYTRAQFWVFVPLLFVWLALRQATEGRGR